MNKLSIKHKLLILVCVAIGTLLVAGAFSAWQAHRLNRQLTSAITTHHKLLEAVNIARGAQVNFKIQVQEWKNILLRGKDPANFDKYLAGFDKEEKAVLNGLTSLKNILDELSASDKINIEDAIATMQKLGPHYRNALASYDRGLPDPAAVVDKLVKGIDREPTQMMDKVVQEIQQLANEISRQERSAAESIYTATKTGLLSFLSVACLLSGFLGWLIFTSITRPVNSLEQTMTRIAESGDLTRRATVTHKDEIGSMANSFNNMINRMQELVGKVSVTTSSVNSAAGEMSKTAEVLHATANDQAESVASNAASVEQLTVSIATVADTAEDVSSKSAQSVNNTMEGNRKVAEIVAEINRIESTVKDIATAVEQFVSSTSAITGTTKKVREIADQTNLLALNAAIEAARAGEQGRGFAVVADEVRKLAEKSGSSAMEIDAMAVTIMEQTIQVRSAIEEGFNSIRATSGLAGEVENSLNLARQTVEQASVGVSEIANSVKEQKIASTEIAQSMERISVSAEETSSAAGQMRNSAESLRLAANDLSGSIAEFRI